MIENQPTLIKPEPDVAAAAGAQPSSTVAYPVTAPPIKLIDIKGVGAILGLKDTAVRDLIDRKALPPPIKFGRSRRATARWIEAEIYVFAWSLAAERQKDASVSDAKNFAHKTPAAKISKSRSPPTAPQRADDWT